MSLQDTLFETDEEKQQFYELLGELKATDSIPARISGVYVIYDKQTGEPLYVGQSSNILQRLVNHFNGSQNAGLQQQIEQSSAEYESLWDEAAVRWVEIDESKAVRERYETAFELELEPKFSSH